jgi:hypothetical protein
MGTSSKQSHISRTTSQALIGTDATARIFTNTRLIPTILFVDIIAMARERAERMSRVEAILESIQNIIMAVLPWMITMKILLTAAGGTRIDWIDAGLILSYMFLARRRNPNF